MNKIKKSRGSITIYTDSGYSSSQEFKSPDPINPLLAMLDEIGRVLTITGDAELARKTLNEAIERTEKDMKS